MLTGDRLIGAFTIYRQTVRPFDSKTLEVAQMFADQSVMAIENARLISRERAR
jgi:GAF domain-containing protein